MNRKKGRKPLLIVSGAIQKIVSTVIPEGGIGENTREGRQEVLV